MVVGMGRGRESSGCIGVRKGIWLGWGGKDG